MSPSIHGQMLRHPDYRDRNFTVNHLFSINVTKDSCLDVESSKLSGQKLYSQPLYFQLMSPKIHVQMLRHPD